MVKLLLERGIHVNAVDKFGRSALFLAVQTEIDFNEAIDDLEETYEINYSSEEYYASKEIISELLQYGADINLQDDSGNTVLTTFCRLGLFFTILFIIYKIKDYMTNDKYDETNDDDDYDDDNVHNISYIYFCS